MLDRWRSMYVYADDASDHRRFAAPRSLVTCICSRRWPRSDANEHRRRLPHRPLTVRPPCRPQPQLQPQRRRARRRLAHLLRRAIRRGQDQDRGSRARAPWAAAVAGRDGPGESLGFCNLRFDSADTCRRGAAVFGLTGRDQALAHRPSARRPSPTPSPTPTPPPRPHRPSAAFGQTTFSAWSSTPLWTRPCPSSARRRTSWRVWIRIRIRIGVGMGARNRSRTRSKTWKWKGMGTRIEMDRETERDADMGTALDQRQGTWRLQSGQLLYGDCAGAGACVCLRCGWLVGNRVFLVYAYCMHVWSDHGVISSGRACTLLGFRVRGYCP